LAFIAVNSRIFVLLCVVELTLYKSTKIGLIDLTRDYRRLLDNSRIRQLAECQLAD